MNAYRDRGLLPAGLRDDLPPLAGFEAELTERIMRRVASHGYERVTTRRWWNSRKPC